VNSVSFNPSQKSSDGHKSIGRGGSFWLPPKMSTENFETNLKQFSNSTPSQKSFPSKSLGSGGGDRVLNDSFKGLISQSSANGSAGKSKPSSMLGVTSNELGKSSPVNLKNAANLVTAKPFSNTAIPSPFSNKYSSVSTKTLPANISLPAQKSLSHLNSGPPKPEVLKKRHFDHDGTKSAFDALNDNLSRELPEKTDNETAQNQSGTFSFDQFSDNVTNLLLDAPLLFAASQDVVRFAVTLDNGSSVSVRIENMEDSAKVCFVSEDVLVLKDLSIKFSPQSFSSSEGKPSLNFYFFNSYSQMDRAFSKPSPQL
jgi:hypothetical protein